MIRKEEKKERKKEDMKEGESDWIGVLKLDWALAVIQKETAVAQVDSPPWSVAVHASPEGVWLL